MAITISGENNNDKILASDGVIDQLSGFNVVGVMTATSFTGDLTGDVTGNVVGNLTGNVNSTSNLLLQIGGSEKFRVGGSGQLGIGGANYGTSGQVLTSGGSGSAASWSTILSNIVEDTSPQLGGDLDVNGKKIKFPDLTGSVNNILYFGTGDDLLIYHHADVNYIQCENSRTLRIQQWTGSGNETLANFIPNGAVQLYHNDTKTFETTNEGATFDTGSSSCVVRLTSNTDAVTVLQGYNSDFYLKGPSGGNLILYANANEDAIKCIPNGAVELYHNGNRQVFTIDGGMNWQDSKKAEFGNSGDLKIYHESGVNYIYGTGTNAPTVFMTGAQERLRITSGGTALVNKTSTSDYGKFEVKGGTADNIETADITAKTIATFSGSTPGTTAAGKGAGIVIKPIADRGCNYFLGVANDSANQEAHGRFIIRSGNFAGQTTERLRINANGELQISGNCEPAADTTYDLGANVNNRWRNIYGQTLSLTSYAVIGSLVVNDPGSSYYSFNNRIQGNTIIKGTTVCTDDIGSKPSTFPASNVQLMVYTSTNGQPISNTDCARLLIATDAKQVGAQGYNGALDFGNSDATASGDSNQYEYRTASIMSNAAGDTGTSGYADGDLQFWTKSSNGSLTKRVVITQAGNTIFGNSISEGTTEPFFVETGGTIRRRYQTTNGSGIHFTGSALMPTTGTGAFSNGGINIGTGSYRWGQIYSSSSSISTSDRTLKNTIQSSDLGLEFIKKLNPVSYKFNDGNSGRTHYGLISQDVETVLSNLGKTGIDFGGFCKDRNTRVETKPDENGDIIDVNIEEEGHTYSLRYEEFISPLVKAVQELSTEVETLKTKVAALEGS